MVVDPVTTALQALPDATDNLTVALTGAAAGARVLPVLRQGNTFVPIALAMGPGRSPWTAATPDPDRLRSLFAEHPHAIPAFVDRTDFGLRARVWSGDRLTTLPTVHVKV